MAGAVSRRKNRSLVLPCFLTECTVPSIGRVAFINKFHYVFFVLYGHDLIPHFGHCCAQLCTLFEAVLQGLNASGRISNYPLAPWPLLHRYQVLNCSQVSTSSRPIVLCLRRTAARRRGNASCMAHVLSDLTMVSIPPANQIADLVRPMTAAQTQAS